MDDIPDWAWDHAKRMIDAQPDCGPGWAKRLAPIGVVRAFARYIAEHEKPPVDPLLAEAAMIAEKHGQPIGTPASAAMAVALAALRRGIELGKSA